MQRDIGLKIGCPEETKRILFLKLLRRIIKRQVVCDADLG